MAPVRNKLGSILTKAPSQTSTIITAGCGLAFVFVKLFLLDNSCCFCQCGVTHLSPSANYCGMVGETQTKPHYLTQLKGSLNEHYLTLASP